MAYTHRYHRCMLVGIPPNFLLNHLPPTEASQGTVVPATASEPQFALQARVVRKWGRRFSHGSVGGLRLAFWEGEIHSSRSMGKFDMKFGKTMI